MRLTRDFVGVGFLSLVSVAFGVHHPCVAHAADRGALRLLVVDSGERLGSEQKALAQIEKVLGKSWAGPIWVQRGDTDEVAAAKELFAGRATKSPAAWAGADVVLAIELLPAAGKKPNRVSRGLGAIAAIRMSRVAPAGGSVSPTFAIRVDGKADLPFFDERLAPWLASLVGTVGGGS